MRRWWLLLLLGDGLNTCLKLSVLFLKVVIFLTLKSRCCLEHNSRTPFFFSNHNDKAVSALKKGSQQLPDLSHFQSHSAESWCHHCLFVYMKHIHLYPHISDEESRVCVCMKPLRVWGVFCCNMSSEMSADSEVCVGPLISCSSFQGSLLPQGAICVCVCVCLSASMYSTTVALSVYSLQAWGAGYCSCVLCVRWKEKALFQRTYQSPAFSPGLFFFLWFDVFLFFIYYVSHVLWAFYDIKCLCQGWQD